MKGKFITLEGCEGVGKSTQLKLLKTYLENTEQEAIFTREPGGTPEAEAIRSIILDVNFNISPRVEAVLFAAARISHIEKMIIPNLEKGKLVISDRFIDSSFAYQGIARNLGFDYIKEINSYAIAKCMPDCTIFIDMDPENSWRKQKGTVVLDDRMENETMEFHKKCYIGFDSIANIYPERVVRIVPDIDKTITHEKIVQALRDKGIIK